LGPENKFQSHAKEEDVACACGLTAVEFVEYALKGSVEASRVAKGKYSGLGTPVGIISCQFNRFINAA
jgi:hypothetical protein